jgi:hypothetical protein
MGWMIFDQRTRELDFLLATGKTLFLCQHFESTCKEIVTWFCVTKALIDKKFGLLSDEHKDYVDKLMHLFLDKSIRKLKDIPKIASKEEIDILREAKESRNFICHECLIDLIYAPYPYANPQMNINLFKQHIVKVARGDYIVSRWSYEFHEKDSGALKNKEGYVSALEEWVFPKTK